MWYIPAKAPWFLKKIFKNYVWNISTHNKVVYLTFDDGPTKTITPWVLDVLDKYKAKATFFCIGNNIKNNLIIFKDTIARGHTAANHTYNHTKGWKTNLKTYLEEVEQTQAIISENTLNQTTNTLKLFRPPYVQITPKQGKVLINKGYNIIMWSVVAIDWTNKVTPEQCVKNAINNTKSGDIIVFHDSVKAQTNLQYALPKVLDYFTKKGFRFEAITHTVA